MSLTQHLRGDLGEVIAAATPMLRGVAVEMAGELADDPVRPRQRLALDHYALTGQIVGQRLADLVQPAPPYAALLGAVRVGAISLAEAGELACRWPSHRSAPGPREQAVFTRPTPAGWWRMLTGTAEPGPGDEHVAATLDQAAAHAPTPGVISSMAAERARLDVAVVLAHLETVHRAGRVPVELEEFAATGQPPVPAALRDDVAAVLQRTKRHLSELTPWISPGQPALGFASPAIVPRWADADVLLGPGADGAFTLVDIKTVTSADPDRMRGWLQQVLAYALLDAADRWKIRRIGLWLPRYGRVLVRPLQDVAGGLLQPAARAAVLTAARTAAAADGADITVLG